MNEVKRTLVAESPLRAYLSPEIKILSLHSEGVLCSSLGAGHEGFGDGGEYDL